MAKFSFPPAIKSYPVFSRFVFLFFLIAIAAPSYSQELVTNGSFETTSLSVTYRQKENNWNPGTFASGWGRPNTGTPDVFTDNVTASDPSYNTSTPPLICYPEACTYDNHFGQQNPRAHTMAVDGNTYNHNYVMLYYNAEYISQTLTGSLVAGSCYQLSFWVSLADRSEYATYLDAVLTTSPISSTNSGKLSVPSGATFLSTEGHHPDFITNKTGWTKVVFNFKATGGEHYLTIGHFSTDSLDVSADNGDCTSCSSACVTNLIGTAVYFIDDVSLHPKGESFPVAGNRTFTNTSINANYSNDSILLTGDIVINGSNVVWTSCNIRCNSNATITIGSGSSLRLLSGTRLSAGCDMMWKGITVNGTGRIIMDDATILDAQAAVTVNDNGGWQITNSHFSRNDVDFVNNSASVYTASNFIKSSIFDKTISLRDSTQGLNGYGTNAMQWSGAGTSVEKIGGTVSSDACYFYGGQHAITSTNQNLDINLCFLSGSQQEAVEFHGSDAARKSLVVTSCTFINNRRHIVSTHNTNLTAQKNSFSYSLEHAIDWEDNHDCVLKIGDSLDPSLGNTFQYNAWCDVVAWGNASLLASSSTRNATMATDTIGSYTTIVISNNTMHTAPYGGNILVGEWSLMPDATYQSLNISQNTIYDATKGIQIYDVHGWGGLFPLGNPITDMPPQAAFGNMIYTSTAQTAMPFGVKVKNAPGLSISQNGVSSDNPFNYANVGIMIEDSHNSEIYGNIESAGTCMFLGLDMIGSAVHCNWFTQYAVGFSLNCAWLCGDSTALHGSTSEEYNNLLPYTSYPWNTDISVYYSLKKLNQWVWNGANSNLTISYAGNTGSGSSIISPTTGSDRCAGPLGSPIYANSGNNVAVDFAGDADAQWRSDYSYEAIRLATGDGDPRLVSDNIKSIIRIETLIAQGEYDTAKVVLGGFSPANHIETNYQTVLAIFADLNAPVERLPNAGELETLENIAAENSRTGGNAVTLARAYLAVKYNLYFNDPRPTDGEINGTATISSPCSLEPTSQTWLGLMDEKGGDLDIAAYVESDGSFIFDPQHLAYYNALYPSTRYRIYSKQGSQYTVVDHDFKTIGDWITASPNALSLSGVAVALDTVTETEYTNLDAHASVTDHEGNTYALGIYTGANGSDFLLTKYDSDNKTVWERMFDGVVSGDDTATCLALDEAENIYVAGKVFNGGTYDIEILKYSPDGYSLWQSMIADTEFNNNTPIAIYVDPNDQSVKVNAIQDNGDSIGDYRYVQYWQCLPESGRLGGHPMPQEDQAAAASTISFYPNPSSDGTIIFTGKVDLVEIYTIDGQLVTSSAPGKDGVMHLPNSQVSKGVYIVKVLSNGSWSFNKLIIN